MSDSSPPLALHRCRFVDASPSPITVLAFPPLPLPSLTTKATGKQRERDRDRGAAFGTLVVGHANGNIDLLEWTGEPGESQASQAWHRRKVGLLTPSRSQYSCPSTADAAWTPPIESRLLGIDHKISRYIFLGHGPVHPRSSPV